MQRVFWGAGTLFFLIALVLASMILFAEEAQASPVIRTGETVSLQPEHSLSGDLYALGSIVSMAADGAEDFYAVGGSVGIKSPIKEDVVVLGGVVEINSNVGDDVRILGGQAVISGKVGGDVAVIGGSLTILSSADVEGDILFYGNELKVEGPVGGNIYARGEKVRIDSAVEGDVDAVAHVLMSVGANGAVKGGVTYTSARDITRALESSIDGQVIKRAGAVYDLETQFRPFVVRLLMTLFSALSIFFLFGRRIEPMLLGALRMWKVNLLWGLVSAIAFPVVGAVLIVSFLGSILGIALLFFYGFLLMLSWALSAIIAGVLALELARRSPQRISLVAVGLGSVLLSALALIPYIGWTITMLGVVLSLGSLVSFLYGRIR